MVVRPAREWIRTDRGAAPSAKQVRRANRRSNDSPGGICLPGGKGRMKATSRRIAAGSVIVSLVILAVKYAAYALTGSVALFSDALESVVNVLTALAAMAAIRIGARPADEQHPYGHHKAEYLSAVAVGAAIVMAAIAILREAWHGFLSPVPIESAWEGLAVSGLATALNAAWSAVLIRSGRASRSAALVADGKHLLADVVTSLAVIVGVGLAVVTGLVWMDSAIAALVAVNVLWSGWQVLRENASGLLDEVAPPEELAEIVEIIDANSQGARGFHDLRTRHAGRATFVEFHLTVPGEMVTRTAHEICDRIEAGLKQRFPDSVVTIHVEPE